MPKSVQQGQGPNIRFLAIVILAALLCGWAAYQTLRKPAATIESEGSRQERYRSRGDLPNAKQLDMLHEDLKGIELPAVKKGLEQEPTAVPEDAPEPSKHF